MRDRAPPAVFRMTAEGQPCPDHSRARYVYVDNLGVAGCEQKEVASSLDLVVETLEGQGLSTHELSVASRDAAPLGVVFNGEELYTALSRKRYWNILQAGRYALSRRAVPGWGWEVLLGHFTFAGLVNRDSLFAFHCIYAFYSQELFSRGSTVEECS